MSMTKAERTRGALSTEIADAFVFVAPDKAAYITDQVFRVNGGKTLS